MGGGGHKLRMCNDNVNNDDDGDDDVDDYNNDGSTSSTSIGTSTRSLVLEL